MNYCFQLGKLLLLVSPLALTSFNWQPRLGLDQKDGRETISGNLQCGVYKIKRGGGLFDGTICGGEIHVRGTYSAGEIRLTDVAYNSLRLAASESFAITDTAWSDPLYCWDMLGQALLAANSSLARAGFNWPPALETLTWVKGTGEHVNTCHSTTDGRGVCGVVIFSTPLRENLKVYPEGIAITLPTASVRVDHLEVRGALVSIGSNIRAETATIVGAAVTDGALEATSLRLREASIAVGELNTNSLEATNSRISVNQKITVNHGKEPSRGAAPFRVSSTSVVAPSIDAEALDAINSTLSVRRISAGTLRFLGGTIDGENSLDIRVGKNCNITATTIRASRISADLAEAVIGADTLFNANGGGANPRTATYLEGGGPQRLKSSGASYGGYGGTSGNLYLHAFSSAEPPIGNPLEPLGPGLGGFGSGSEPGDLGRGGKGGGVITILAKSLTWDGLASVNGESAFPHGGGASADEGLGGGGGGGSGGSILIQVRGILSGSGRFEANGGDGSYSGGPELEFVTGGGGSGGRIRIEFGTLRNWSGQVRALGGWGGRRNPALVQGGPPWNSMRNHGGPGAVFWKPSGKSGTIVIDGTGGPGGVAAISGNFPGMDVEIRGGIAVMSSLMARNLILTQGAVLTADSPLIRLDWPPPQRYEVSPGVLHSSSNYYQPIYPDSVWEHPLEKSVSIRLSGDLRIDDTSRIDLSQLGGYGRQEFLTNVPERLNRSGGSHGGAGGAGRSAGEEGTGRPTAPRGSSLEPTMVGEGGFGRGTFDGGVLEMCALGGTGGGALRLVVEGALYLEGQLRADGAPGAPDTAGCLEQGTGGGAGGSVWITAREILGGGLVTASGGEGAFENSAISSQANWGGGGGGGRIAIYADTSRFIGAIRADGGAGAFGGGIDKEVFRGEPGSIIKMSSSGSSNLRTQAPR